MKHTHILAVTASFALLLAVDESAAEETRQHGTHEHGTAQLLVAVEGHQLQVSLESPAYNLAGFEVASSEQQHDVVAHVYKLLQQPTTLFALDAASCAQAVIDIDGGLFEEEHEGEHEGEHEDEHHDEHHDEHKEAHEEEHHDEHHNEHDDKHEEHADEHDDEHDHEGEGGHSDISVQWNLECESLDQLQQLQVNLFEHFEHLQKLDVQYLVGSKQGAQQLSTEQSVLTF